MAMELMKLDSARQANTPVYDYDSCIWTERYNTVGDFQIVTGQIERFMELLPEGSLLTLRESIHTMQVETHKIERKKNSPAKLTITGRSWESVLDRRVALKSLTDMSEWVINAKTPSDVAWFVINQICVLGSLSNLDIFPGAVLQFPVPADYLTGTGPAKAFPMQRGNLLAAILPLLQTETPADPLTSPATPAVVPHGIRAVRPNAAGTAVAIEIYVGTDKSDKVVFDGTRDGLDDGTYLFSKVGSADTAYVLGETTSGVMNERPAATSGLDRRVILLDATSSGVDSIESLTHQASTALSDAHETSLYEGSLNQDLALYRYNVDFDLGDIVRLDGDYGLSQKARVAEFIRSDDQTGYKAYPSLVALPA